MKAKCEKSKCEKSKCEKSKCEKSKCEKSKCEKSKCEKSKCVNFIPNKYNKTCKQLSIKPPNTGKPNNNKPLRIIQYNNNKPLKSFVELNFSGKLGFDNIDNIDFTSYSSEGGPTSYNIPIVFNAKTLKNYTDYLTIQNIDTTFEYKLDKNQKFLDAKISKITILQDTKIIFSNVSNVGNNNLMHIRFSQNVNTFPRPPYVITSNIIISINDTNNNLNIPLQETYNNKNDNNIIFKDYNTTEDFKKGNVVYLYVCIFANKVETQDYPNHLSILNDTTNLDFKLII
jgi:hypothetical protein